MFWAISLAAAAAAAAAVQLLLQPLLLGDVDEREHRALDHVLEGAVRLYAHLEDTLVAARRPAPATGPGCRAPSSTAPTRSTSPLRCGAMSPRGRPISVGIRPRIAVIALVKRVMRSCSSTNSVPMPVPASMLFMSLLARASSSIFCSSSLLTVTSSSLTDCSSSLEVSSSSLVDCSSSLVDCISSLVD